MNSKKITSPHAWLSSLRNQLQVVSRGMLGRKRAAARRSMIAAATRALEWVSLERLQPGHLKELARAIHGALVDPVVSKPATPFLVNSGKKTEVGSGHRTQVAWNRRGTDLIARCTANTWRPLCRHIRQHCLQYANWSDTSLGLPGLNHQCVPPS